MSNVIAFISIILGVLFICDFILNCLIRFRPIHRGDLALFFSSAGCLLVAMLLSLLSL